MTNRIHVFGASGSGTTTLGPELSNGFGHTHLDVDTYYWEATKPPFQVKRDPQLRRSLLSKALVRTQRWVLTGSLSG